MAVQTLTSAELAARLETTPKRLRRFLRSDDSPVTPVGKGNRYTIEARQVRQLKKLFISWQNQHTRPEQQLAA